MDRVYLHVVLAGEFAKIYIHVHTKQIFSTILQEDLSPSMISFSN